MSGILRIELTPGRRRNAPAGGLVPPVNRRSAIFIFYKRTVTVGTHSRTLNTRQRGEPGLESGQRPLSANCDANSKAFEIGLANFGRPPGMRIHSEYNVFNLHRL